MLEEGTKGTTRGFTLEMLSRRWIIVMEAIVSAGKMSSHSDRQMVWVHIDGIGTRLLYHQSLLSKTTQMFRLRLASGTNGRLEVPDVLRPF